MNTDVLEKNGKNTAPKQTGSPKAKSKGKFVAWVVVLFLIAALCVIVQSFNSSFIKISANFSSVTDGKNPDGSPFDINEVLSDEVLESASQKLEGKVDIATLKKHLSVHDNTSESDNLKLREKIVDGNTDYSFYPNVYTLTYSVVSDSIKNEGFLASVNAVCEQFSMPTKAQILKSVADSYSEYYFEKYIAGNVAMSTDWSEADSLDYYNKATETKEIAKKISRFISTKYNKNPEFVSAEGIGYGDLYTEIEQIINIDISNFKSFIIQNGITADKAPLLRQFAFMENMYNEKYLRHTSAYEITKDVINFYDSDTTKVVFVPAIDEERTFYMNRTKVGIDYLIEKASTENILADDAFHEAENYRYLTAHFSSAEPVAQEVLDATDAMYAGIKGKINDFINKAELIINEGSKVGEHEKIEVGKAAGNFDMVSMVICGAKIFIMLSLISFLAVSLVELMSKNRAKKRTVGEQ